MTANPCQGVFKALLDKAEFLCKMVAMKEKDDLKNIQDAIQNEAIKERVAEIINKSKKKVSNKKISEIIASETLKYKAIRKNVTELVMGKKQVSISEALGKAGFSIIEETKHFGINPVEKQGIKKESL